MGIAIGDVNNDGKPDLSITQVVGAALPQSRRVDISGRDGRVWDPEPEWGTSCAMFDYDRDGWLDLFFVNYVSTTPRGRASRAGGERDYCSPAVFPATASRLFRNRGGAKPAFEDVTEKSGLWDKRAGLGVAVADFDGDGWPDLFVANDGRPNHLWMNQRVERRFAAWRSRGRPAAGGEAFAGMGAAAGGRRSRWTPRCVRLAPDERNKHSLATGTGGAVPRPVPRGLDRAQASRHGLRHDLADLDLDGRLDISVVNGRVTRRAPASRTKPGLATWEPYAERNQVFANTGSAFRDVSHNNRHAATSRSRRGWRAGTWMAMGRSTCS